MTTVLLLRPVSAARKSCLVCSQRVLSSSAFPTAQPAAALQTDARRSTNHAIIRTSLPKQILLLRHGRSLGNEDETLFSRLPDWKIPLSDEGKLQARRAGATIQRIVGDAPIMFYVSPYRRTKQTYDELQHHVTSDVLFTREEPRLREQDFGNFQDTELIQKAKKERVDFGRFFFRFPDGESGADVFDRISAFTSTFRQDCESINRPDASAVFVTHGITARLFVMRWLHWTVDDFESLHNPNNCAIIVLKREDSADGDGHPTYRLTRESRELLNSPTSGGIGRALKLGQILARDGRNQRSGDGSRSGWDFGGSTSWGL